MGFIADIFEFIGDLIGSIINAIADAIEWISTKIMDFLDGIGGLILIGVFAGFIFAPALMTTIITSIGTAVRTIGTFVWDASKWVVQHVITSVQWLGNNFQAFLEMIHFKELLTIHSIAMILSADYRNMMLGVYRQISEFSQAVFGTTEMMHLLLQGSRQMIYAMSSSVGYPTDIAELQWVSSLDDTLAKINERAEEYMNNPEAILDDIAEWVYTPFGDQYSGINQGFVLALEGVIKGVEGVAGQVFEINYLTQQTISYLPQPLRGTLQETLAPIDERISTFQYDVYEPKMAEIDHVLGQVAKENDDNREHMSALTDRLINPADYLGELDDLPKVKRIESKERIRLSLDEPREVERIEYHAELETEIQDIQMSKPKIPEPSTAPPEYLTLEPERPLVVVPGVRKGWFVGDY